jgi:LPXTG-motif cell wall-anchored protein
LLALGVIAVGIAQVNPTTAVAAGFAGTITPGCVLPGGNVTVRLSGAPAGAVISFQTSYGGPQANQASASVVGTANASGVFAATFIVGKATSPGMGMVSVYEFDLAGTWSGVGNYTIGNVAGGCPTPGVATFGMSEITPTDKYSVQLTCDAGLSGDGVFDPTVFVIEVTDFHFPPMTLRCNAAPVRFPAVPSQAGVKFHQRTTPAGAVPSADVWAGRPPNTLVVIHNARAAGTVIPAAPLNPMPTAAATPTPTPTPFPSPTPSATPRPTVIPAPNATGSLVHTGRQTLGAVGLLAGGLAFIGVGALVYRRRRRRTG